MTQTIQNTYQLKCVDRFGTLVSPLPNAQLSKVRWELNMPGQIIYTLPQNCPEISYPQENINEVQLWIGSNGGTETLQHWGFHHGTKETPNTVEFTCPGLLQYFKFHYVTNTSFSYGVDENHAPLTLGVEQMIILGDLVQQAQFGLGNNRNIQVADYTPSGVLRYRFYDITKHQNFLDDMFSEFPTLADAYGNPTGLDFDIDVTSQVGRRLWRMYYPKKGIVHTDLALEYGKNVTDYTVTIDGSKQETEVYFTGGSDGDIKFENHAQTTNTSLLDSYGNWQAVKAQAGENDVDVLLSLCYKDLANFSHPPATPEITAVEVSDALLGVLNTGDSVPLKIQNGRTNINGTYRIYYIEWLPGPGNLKLGLATA